MRSSNTFLQAMFVMGESGRSAVTVAEEERQEETWKISRTHLSHYGTWVPELAQQSGRPRDGKILGYFSYLHVQILTIFTLHSCSGERYWWVSPFPASAATLPSALNLLHPRLGVLHPAVRDLRLNATVPSVCPFLAGGGLRSPGSGTPALSQICGAQRAGALAGFRRLTEGKAQPQTLCLPLQRARDSAPLCERGGYCLP